MKDEGLPLDVFVSKGKEFALFGSYRKLLSRPDGLQWRVHKYPRSSTAALVPDDWEILKKLKAETATSTTTTTTTTTTPTPTIAPALNNSSSSSSSVSNDDDQLRALELKFKLPSSTYATMLFRELCRVSSSTRFHKDLTNKTHQNSNISSSTGNDDEQMKE
jgi:tRNA(Glu) U13 pseudouridine synthase TruD